METTARSQSVPAAARVVDAQASDFAQELRKVEEGFTSSAMTVPSVVMSLMAEINFLGRAEAAEEAYCDEETDQTAAKNPKLGLVEATSGCLTVAADHDATITSREEELNVIAECKKILQELTAGADAQTYSFPPMSGNVDLRRGETTVLVKNLAKSHYSPTLAQLAFRIGVVMQYGGADQGVFNNVKSLITGMIANFGKEAEKDTAEKVYCNKGMAKIETKKADLEDDIEKLTTTDCLPPVPVQSPAPTAQAQNMTPGQLWGQVCDEPYQRRSTHSRNSCAICLSDCQTPTMLVCGHVFCGTCIKFLPTIGRKVWIDVECPQCCMVRSSNSAVQGSEQEDDDEKRTCGTQDVIVQTDEDVERSKCTEHSNTA